MTDFLAFLVIVILATKSELKGFKMPRILRTIVRDATVYFLVIFTSDFVLEMTLLSLLSAIGVILNNFYPSIQLLPAT